MCCLNPLLLPRARSFPGGGWFSGWVMGKRLTIARCARAAQKRPPSIAKQSPDGLCLARRVRVGRMAQSAMGAGGRGSRCARPQAGTSVHECWAPRHTARVPCHPPSHGPEQHGALHRFGAYDVECLSDPQAPTTRCWFLPARGVTEDAPAPRTADCHSLGPNWDSNSISSRQASRAMTAESHDLVNRLTCRSSMIQATPSASSF